MRWPPNSPSVARQGERRSLRQLQALYQLYPEAILWLGFTSNDPAVKERFNLFLKVWPEVRQRIPHALLQEMRITADCLLMAR